MNRKAIYTDIYRRNYWNSRESVSGAGSEIKHNKILIEHFSNFLNKWEVKNILDIPCGDYNFMKEIDLPVERYIGADIVDEIVQRNKERYEDEKHSFWILDIIENQLPKVDLIIVKDLFIHFSYEDILKSIVNILQSGSKYLLTSNSRWHENEDIPTGGGWRAVNLEAKPFNFVEPIDNIDNLYLWEISKMIK